MPENAKICVRCGSLEWCEEYTETLSKTFNYSPNDQGEFEGEWSDSNESYGDSEPSGNNTCMDCGSIHLESLEDLTEEDIVELMKIPSKERCAAAREMQNGNYYKAQPERKGKMIGKRVRQF